MASREVIAPTRAPRPLVLTKGGGFVASGRSLRAQVAGGYPVCVVPEIFTRRSVAHTEPPRAYWSRRVGLGGWGSSAAIVLRGGARGQLIVRHPGDHRSCSGGVVPMCTSGDLAGGLPHLNRVIKRLAVCAIVCRGQSGGVNERFDFGRVHMCPLGHNPITRHILDGHCDGRSVGQLLLLWHRLVPLRWVSGAGLKTADASGLPSWLPSSSAP